MKQVRKRVRYHHINWPNLNLSDILSRIDLLMSAAGQVDLPSAFIRISMLTIAEACETRAGKWL
jgi:hypothetical protein